MHSKTSSENMEPCEKSGLLKQKNKKRAVSPDMQVKKVKLEEVDEEDENDLYSWAITTSMYQEWLKKLRA